MYISFSLRSYSLAINNLTLISPILMHLNTNSQEHIKIINRQLIKTRASIDANWSGGATYQIVAIPNIHATPFSPSLYIIHCHGLKFVKILLLILLELILARWFERALIITSFYSSHSFYLTLLYLT